MFYSTTVLTKRGPLAKVWLAAHVSNKLTKAMALSTNISAAVTRIITPEAPMALRLSSQLLLGVARIFSRKTKYLLADSADALARLKLAYTPPSSNDLTDAHANPAAITIADAGGGGGDGASSACRCRTWTSQRPTLRQT
jgi:cohesin complex subunit SCC1